MVSRVSNIVRGNKAKMPGSSSLVPSPGEKGGVPRARRASSCFFACLCLMLLGQTSFPSQSLAQTVSSVGSTQSMTGAAQVDLSSTERHSAQQSSDSRVIDLQLGGSTRQVRAADALTDAERVAFNQVLSTGQQLLQLGALGNAVGGSFRADSDLRGTVAGLVIPQGVTAIHDFGSGSPLSILGNLTNAGSLFAVTSNPAVANATISAGNIFNQQGEIGRAHV